MESSAEEPAAPAPEDESDAEETDNQAAPADEPARDDNEADASAEAETAEANPKED